MNVIHGPLNLKQVRALNEKNRTDDLWGGSKFCVHNEVPQTRGGTKCTKCGAWFCY